AGPGRAARGGGIRGGGVRGGRAPALCCHRCPLVLLAAAPPASVRVPRCYLLATPGPPATRSPPRPPRHHRPTSDSAPALPTDRFCSFNGCTIIAMDAR